MSDIIKTLKDSETKGPNNIPDSGMTRGLLLSPAHPRKSRKRSLGRAMKSAPQGKAVWADIFRTKCEIACPELILIGLT